MSIVERQLGSRYCFFATFRLKGSSVMAVSPAASRCSSPSPAGGSFASPVPSRDRFASPVPSRDRFASPGRSSSSIARGPPATPARASRLGELLDVKGQRARRLDACQELAAPLTRSEREFLVVRSIGSGDFGSTAVVRHIPSSAEGCLKRVRGSSGSEGSVLQLLNDLRNPSRCLPRLYGFWNEPGEHLIFMEYLPGEILPGTISGDDKGVLDVLRQLCSMLSFLDDARVVHGDVKPDNLRTRADGTTVLCDYGQALVVPRNRQLAFPSLLCQLGARAFLAPEGATLPANSYNKHDPFATALTVRRMAAPADAKGWKQWKVGPPAAEAALQNMTLEDFAVRMSGKEASAGLAALPQ